jgi:hypothetical protein
MLLFLVLAGMLFEPGVGLALYKVKQVSGKVVDINTYAMTVTVEKDGKRIVLQVDGATKIMETKEKITIYEIAPGSRVKVKYTEINGQNAAKSIIVGPPD